MLQIIKEFFEQLERNDIPYVHWKSNARLNDFLMGESDLDLLFYPKDRSSVNTILSKINAKKFEALPVNKFNSIEDFLAVDPETAKLIHFHIHYQLEIGEKNVKRYSVDWLEEVLENRIKDLPTNIWITSHEHEILLLIIRESLRIPPLKSVIARNRIILSDKSLSEFLWLKEKSDDVKFLEIINRLFKDQDRVIEKVNYIYKEGLTVNKVCELRNELFEFRKEYQTNSDAKTLFVLIFEKLRGVLNRNLKKLGIIYPSKRTNNRKGTIIVLTGSDGSGKSTSVHIAAEIFGRKTDVVTLYFGLPKPEKSNYPGLVSFIYKLRLKRLWNLYTKKRNLQRALRLREKGIIVICDRFPQSKYPGFMDGPLAATWKSSANMIKRWFSKYEERVFQQIESESIDMVIKLIVDPLTSHNRGELPLQLAKKKTEIVNDLIYPGASEIQEIDAIENGIEDVRIKVVNLIWSKIR